MKPETNRQGVTVTTVTHDATPVPVSLLDEAVERYTFPLLHQVIDRHEELQTVKRKYVMETYCSGCDRWVRGHCCYPGKRRRKYLD